MKKQFIFTLLSLFTLASLSAQSVIDRHYKHLEDDMDATVVFVSGNLFNYASKIVPEDMEDLGDARTLLESIKSFQLISSNNVSDPKAEYTKGLNDISQSYEPLVLVRDKSNNFALYIDESDDIVHELVGIVAADSNFVVFSLLGEMDLNHVSDVVQKIQEKEKLPISSQQAASVTAYKVYPNPVSSTSTINVDVPEDMIGGTINVVDLSGRILTSVEASSSKMEVPIENATSGSHMVELHKGDISIKKQLLVIE